MDFAESPSFYGINDDVTVSAPRGGPIYSPNFVSPPTTVPLFQSNVLSELQELEVEISSGVALDCGEDISVDELKVFSEEELMDMGMKEVTNDGESNGCSLHLIEDQPRRDGDQGTSVNTISEKSTVSKEASTTLVCSSDSTAMTVQKSSQGKDSKKRNKRGRNNESIIASYIAKVEKIVKIKQKQDEDKAAAKLHSLNMSKIDEEVVSSVEEVEKAKMLRRANSAVKLNTSSIHENLPVRYPEVVLYIEVYRNLKLIKTQEFLVLGNQSLTDLRDQICCQTDHVMQKTGFHNRSGYFLIEDTFYNDMRDPYAIDYSRPILDWLRTSKEEALKKWEHIVNGEVQPTLRSVMGNVSDHQMPRFKAVNMQKAKFRDLKFQLGAGYIFCHQGDCKHRIVIRDMRLIHPEDVQNRAAYPITIFQMKVRFQKCSVCKIYKASKVTVDDKWAGENPCYFCDNCYFLLHYSKDGTLMYSDFSVYDYFPY